MRLSYLYNVCDKSKWISIETLKMLYWISLETLPTNGLAPAYTMMCLLFLFTHNHLSVSLTEKGVCYQDAPHTWV